MTPAARMPFSLGLVLLLLVVPSDGFVVVRGHGRALTRRDLFGRGKSDSAASPEGGDEAASSLDYESIEYTFEPEPAAAESEPRKGLRSLDERPAAPAQLPEDEYRVALARPLGMSVEEMMTEDRVGRVIVTRLVEGGHAADAGVAVGDEIVGVNAMFGDNVWRVEGDGIERVQDLIRACEKDAVTIQLRRSEGRELVEVEFESDLDFVDMWKAVYTDEYPVDAAAVESGGDGEERSAKYLGNVYDEYYADMPVAKVSDEYTEDKSDVPVGMELFEESYTSDGKKQYMPSSAPGEQGTFGQKFSGEK
jgi:hypothetical protein